MHTYLTRTSAISFLLSTLLVGPLAAQQPDLVTDRPDQTESSAIVPRGFVLVEAGLAHEESVEGSGESFADTLVRIGIGGPLELRVGLSGYQALDLAGGGTPNGLGDSSLGLKLGLLEGQGARPQIALLISSTLPTGADGLTSDRADPSFRFLFANDLSSRLSLGTNAGIAWGTESDDTGKLNTESRFEWTASLGLSVTDQLGLFAELYGEVGLGADGSDTLFDGGVTYLVRPNVQFDVSAGVNLAESSEWFVGAGISFRLPR